MRYDITVTSYTILDENTELSLRDLCKMCNISAEDIHDMIAEGLLSPPGNNPQEWRFGLHEVRKIHTALRLQRDLRVNLPGCALVIELLEELQELRRLHRSR